MALPTTTAVGLLLEAARPGLTATGVLDPGEGGERAQKLFFGDVLVALGVPEVAAIKSMK
jgi:hypothetical protein